MDRQALGCFAGFVAATTMPAVAVVTNDSWRRPALAAIKATVHRANERKTAEMTGCWFLYPEAKLRGPRLPGRRSSRCTFLVGNTGEWRAATRLFVAPYRQDSGQAARPGR